MVVAVVAGVSGIVGMSGAAGPAFQSNEASLAANRPAEGFDGAIRRNGERMIEEGRKIFRFDTFGDEAFWGGTLKLHQAIEGERLGGVGPGVNPETALAVGLKVDSEALPGEVLRAIKHGTVNLNDPADGGPADDAYRAHRPGCYRGPSRLHSGATSLRRQLVARDAGLMAGPIGI
jgi:hypothetical protein